MTAQEEFDSTYITSTEICRKLRVTRATVVRGRTRGLLPDPIEVNGGQILMWKREVVTPYLEAWGIALRASRRQLTPDAEQARAYSS